MFLDFGGCCWYVWLVSELLQGPPPFRGGSVCVCGEGGVGELCRVGVLCDMSLVSGTRGVAALIEFVGIVGCGIYCPGYFGVGDV